MEKELEKGRDGEMEGGSCSAGKEELNVKGLKGWGNREN